MTTDAKYKSKTIIDSEKLMTNPEGCPACGQKFNLGDPVVYACGTWGEKPMPIHESDAEFDATTQMYMVRECYESRRSA